MKTRWMHSLAVLALAATQAWGQFDSGSDESDGALNITLTTVIDLSLATTATWDTPSPVSGQGVYDAEQWAVVFKYSTINIDTGTTVSFINHPSGAPVVWLATGDVFVDGEVMLNGGDGAPDGPPIFSTPGPGGFGGGQNPLPLQLQSSGGFGPGGGNGSGFQNHGGHGSYGGSGKATVSGCYTIGIPVGSTYGNQVIFPLIGGSGGASSSTAQSYIPGTT